MNWTELLTSEIEETYRATEGLMRRVDDAQLEGTPKDNRATREFALDGRPLN